MFKKMSALFAAGSVGGLLNSLAVWFFGTAGLASALGVKIAPALSPQWLYPRIVWGGIWGFIFLLPLKKNKILSRGLIFSLGPTLVQLFLVFPMKAHKGMAGLDLGDFTPLFVIFFNGIWGLTAAIWLRFADKR